MLYSSDSIIFLIFTIFIGATLFATLALYTRQSILVAYIALGFILGPYMLKVVSNLALVTEIGNVGVIFLLFLLGLHLQPKRLVGLLSSATVVTVGSSLVCAAVSYLVTHAYGYTLMESLVIAIALIFSSTIIGLKLLPNNLLSQHIGGVVVSILLVQDLLAILALMFVTGGEGGIDLKEAAILLLGLPTLIVVAILSERYVLVKLLRRFERFKEYLFLLPIGWCLSMVILAEALHLSAEVGAFIAGVALAEHRISEYIADNLQPLRDFFLIIFFFSIGAAFNPAYLAQIILPAILLSICILLVKPSIYRYLLTYRNSEKSSDAWQVGWRLGQASEFSLLVAYSAMRTHLIRPEASYLIQAVTIITFIVSSYLVVLFYPTPIAFSERLRQD